MCLPLKPAPSCRNGTDARRACRSPPRADSPTSPPTDPEREQLLAPPPRGRCGAPAPITRPCPRRRPSTRRAPRPRRRVTPSSAIHLRRRWYCPAAMPAPHGSSNGALRGPPLRSTPTPSNTLSAVTMIAPAMPPTASRQLNVRPHARAIGSSLRWARSFWAATPMPIAATSPARITPRWVIRRCAGPDPAGHPERHRLDHRLGRRREPVVQDRGDPGDDRLISGLARHRAAAERPTHAGRPRQDPRPLSHTQTFAHLENRDATPAMSPPSFSKRHLPARATAGFLP